MGGPQSTQLFKLVIARTTFRGFCQKVNKQVAKMKASTNRVHVPSAGDSAGAESELDAYLKSFEQTDSPRNSHGCADGFSKLTPSMPAIMQGEMIERVAN